MEAPRQAPDADQRYESYTQQLGDALGSLGGEHKVYLRIKARHIVAVTQRQLGDPSHLRLLEFGCGIGLMAAQLAPSFKSLTGVDVDPAVVTEASLALPASSFHRYDGQVLPFEDGAYDIAVTVNVLHHIPPAERPATMRELGRVIRPGGLCVIAEHNPWNPFTRWLVSRCRFDHDAVLLRRAESEALLRDARSPLVERRYVVFAPTARPAALRIEDQLSGVPIGAQYIVAGRRSST